MTALPSGWVATGDSRRKQRRYDHPSGWSVQHCGHPTANWPYACVDPRGLVHTAGECCAWGYAFRHLADAIEHAERHMDGRLPPVPEQCELGAACLACRSSFRVCERAALSVAPQNAIVIQRRRELAGEAGPPRRRRSRRAA